MTQSKSHQETRPWAKSSIGMRRQRQLVLAIPTSGSLR